MSWVFTIDDTNRRDLLDLVRTAPAGWRFALERPIYTDLQRMKFNAMCGDLARQVVWNGEKLSAKEWKHWLTAAWNQQRMVAGLEPGTIVFVGDGLGKKSAATVSDLIELAYWFGCLRGVEWSEKAQHTPADPEGPASLEEGTEA